MDQPRHVIPALESVYRTFAPITEPLVRVIAGGSLAIHGFPILFGNTAAAAKFLESVGFENALFWAYVVGVVELVCGLCLAAGFLTRLVARHVSLAIRFCVGKPRYRISIVLGDCGFSFPNTGRGTMVCRCADRLRGVTR